MKMSTVKSFVKQFVAAVQGDNVEVKAQKVFRQAQSALKTQISVSEGALIKFEDAVELAKEQLASTRINSGNLITDPD